MSAEAVLAPTKKKMPLYVKILIGLIVGLLLGYFLPQYAKHLQPIGNAFLKAIKMVVIPLVFSAVTLGIYKMGKNAAELGKLAGIAFLWFYVATGIAMLVGIGLNFVFHPGVGLALEATGSVPKNLATTLDWGKFFLDIIPDNIVAAMAGQKVLPTLFFAICFGLALARIGEKSEPMAKFLDALLEAMFKLTQGILSTAPFAVCSIIAYILASKGVDLLLAMAKLVGVVYIGLFIMAIIFCIVLLILGVNPIKTIKKIAEPLLLAFSTNSSEVTLPIHMAILEKNGMPNKVVSLIIPLGYSFNLDGAALYQALATCFIAEAYGMHLDFSTLATILITALIANKGTANVPGASLVVLVVLFTQIGLPIDGIAIIAGVDYFSGMGRTTINVFGNTVAAIALCKFSHTGAEEFSFETNDDTKENAT